VVGYVDMRHAWGEVGEAQEETIRSPRGVGCCTRYPKYLSGWHDCLLGESSARWADMHAWGVGFGFGVDIPLLAAQWREWHQPVRLSQ